ncbi:MAG: polymer-forming cytoskeletal protein [Chloroflexi bacterium]|nr:polymer-forming cytoskeletal protein [Chloroflexota bacterium]MCY3581230.1 polymer-forming cytoskeletal protein [Chloroflexota bacterium]MCY3715081.1 polymer-forming cytoskeletal protein [Chloroflexota bacterium]MDE2652112.1 polymer-forming cytoskeletal protein [Chloroflexota bacterium]MXV92473.1 polymer-forming cytoskeletal protein [Chloroflexota bacterium]
MSAFFANRRGQAEADAPEPAALVPAGRLIGFDTVVGANTQLEGVFTSSGNVRMDGQFSGALEVSGNILVGESADIRADINARNISIAGSVHGNVCGNKVQLLRTGRIWGDITASALTTEEGAFIDGKINMSGHEALREQGSVADAGGDVDWQEALADSADEPQTADGDEPTQ